LTFDEALESIRATEAARLASFEEDVRAELELADDACALLLAVLVNVGKRTGSLTLDPETGDLSGDVEALQLLAQVYIGIRTFRVIRAARGILAFGYEREAPALDRILVELQAHRREIMEDESGKEALAWLRRERKHGISKRVGKNAPDDLYANLSTDSHGDPAPVDRLRDVDGMIELSPQRGIPTRASLVILYAGMARDQAVVVATAAGIKLEGVEDLDSRIKEAQTKLQADADAEESPQGS
jgi:hypothetical protein